MDRSRYFVTLEKDLYHFDHFMGGFSTRLGGLLRNRGYTILEPVGGVEVRLPACVPAFPMSSGRAHTLETRRWKGVWGPVCW